MRHASALVLSFLWLMGSILVIMFLAEAVRFKAMSLPVFIALSILLLSQTITIFILFREEVRHEIQYLLSKMRLRKRNS